MRSFNQLNNIFESKITDLYSTNGGRKIIVNYSNLIKENELLKLQYNIFSQLKEGVSEEFKSNPKLVEEYVSNITNIFNNYTKKQFKEANNKLYEFVIKNKICDENEIDKLEESNLLKAAEFIIYEGKDNIEECIKQKEVLAKELKLKKEQTEVDNKKDIEEVLKEFNEQYADTLSEEEVNLIKDLVLSDDENKKEQTLKEYQKDCLKTINKILKECDDSEIKERLLTLKEQVLFNEDKNFTNSFIRLSEIKAVINEIAEI